MTLNSERTSIWHKLPTKLDLPDLPFRGVAKKFWVPNLNCE